MATPNKVYHLYDAWDYHRRASNGDPFAVATCYAKNVRGAIKTFESGFHQGSFVVEGAGRSMELYMSIGEKSVPIAAPA